MKYDSSNFKLKIVEKKDKYHFINKILKKFKYHKLEKKEKSLIKKLDKQNRNKFFRKYQASDIALLIETDNIHSCLNGYALVESKNVIIRKHIGRIHVPQRYAPIINEFYKKYFNKYLNFHRVCAFVKSEINEKGKITKTYPFCNYMTPYDKLKIIPDFKTYLNN